MITRKSIGSVLSLAANTVVILLLMIFILLETEHFPARIVYAYGETRSIKILEVAGRSRTIVMKYLSVKTLIAVITGLLFTGFLGACGVEFFVLWGVLAFVLHFIPYVGSYAAALLPVAMDSLYSSPRGRPC